jgi:hypothetical protein
MKSRMMRLSALVAGIGETEALIVLVEEEANWETQAWMGR